MLQAQDAIRFLPAEDKINLAMATTLAPKVDDDSCVMQTVVDLKEALVAANATIAALQSKGTKTKAKNGTSKNS
jgi:hypothetical protein